MKVSYKQIFYFMICAVLMLLPRRWFIFGIQSYRLLLLLLLFLTIKRIGYSKSFFNIVTILYITYIAVYYLYDSGAMSFLGFIIDTVGIFIVVYSNIRSRRELQSFLDIFIKTVACYSVLCIIQTFTGFNIFDIIAGAKSGVASTAVYYRFGLVRSYGSFTTSINNALFLVLAVCIILYKIDCETNKRKKKKNMVALALTSCAIIATLSRFPMMLLVFVFITWLLKRGILQFLLKNIVKVILVISMVCTVFILSQSMRNIATNFTNMFVAVFDDSAQENISESFGVNAGGVGERVLLYTWVREKIRGHEVFGVGPDADIVFKYTDEWNKVREKTSIENQYLKMLSYFGYVGLILFIMFTVVILVYSIKRLKYDSKRIFDFWYMTLIAQISYIICMFSVASVDDMRTYFMLIGCMYIVGERFCNISRTEKCDERIERKLNIYDKN